MEHASVRDRERVLYRREDFGINYQRYSLISWRAVFAGWLLATATALLMFVLGSAIGVTALNAPNIEAIDKGLSFGTAFWLVFTWVISLYVGGMFAGALAPKRDRILGAMHGLTVWALASVLTVLFGITGFYGSLRAGQAVGGSIVAVADPVMDAAVQGAPGEAEQDQSNDQFIGDLKNDISQALSTETGGQVSSDKLRQTMDQLNPGLLAAVARELGEGNVEEAKKLLVDNTSLSGEDIEKVVPPIKRRIEEFKMQVSATAEKVADYTTAALWITFFTAVISLLAAVYGGRAGVGYIPGRSLAKEWQAPTHA